jgi:hypothetical protein
MNQIVFILSMPVDLEFSYKRNFRRVGDAVTRARAPAPHLDLFDYSARMLPLS